MTLKPTYIEPKISKYLTQREKEREREREREKKGDIGLCVSAKETYVGYPIKGVVNKVIITLMY